MSASIDVRALAHRYGDREALRGVSFEVAPGQILALLGPNGGGKTTLFRVIATLLTPTAGTVLVDGHDVCTHAHEVRRRLGVVFQAPALDPALTVTENLTHHGHLYGLRGGALSRRIEAVLEAVRLRDRARDLVRTLSGGLARRVELAKSLLHEPRVLVLDEPSTGLDPGARRDVWDHLADLRLRAGTTILLTTHLMDEAALCDRVAILHRGQLVALGTPHDLTATIGGDVLWISARDAAGVATRLAGAFGLVADVVEGRIRIERERGHELLPQIIEAFPGEIDAASFSRPTLDDVFVHHTGQRFD
jgi:ABC-2 type transport system ATP-binding protein